MITFNCPKCRSQYREANEREGKRVICRKCRAIITIATKRIETEEDADYLEENSPPALTTSQKALAITRLYCDRLVALFVRFCGWYLSVKDDWKHVDERPWHVVGKTLVCILIPVSIMVCFYLFMVICKFKE